MISPIKPVNESDIRYRIGQHLQHIRRIKGVTQEELAELIDVSVGWVSRVERGVNLPNLKLLFRIAKALRVQVNELLPF
ncbi:hypothetical protein KSF_084160 [Reticulibacter mediterranei]|uniref:HTH cro/C1-type domain-containing protein n=1 Tax=Reticulibacter mediterranei TaxID=2778369 RepID=A0A8J3ITM6_9CHLR|nr:helix-turn-helix transcriptional regulator [Reticulibacter mediterranei]GHO98368.1 hypothetical protein KSF_084160 [Reticulibacter mediterranei]